MRVKQFDPRFIAKLIDAGFYINGEAQDRNMVPNQDYARVVRIDGREYYVIIGIYQDYKVENPYSRRVRVYPTEHENNGQLVFDMWSMNGIKCNTHERYVIGTDAVLNLITYYTPLFLCQE